MWEQIKVFLGCGHGGSTAALQHFHVDDGAEEDKENDGDRGGVCEEVRSDNYRENNVQNRQWIKG